MVGYLLLQFTVTVILLVFAFLIREQAPDVATMVVGAAVGYWLSETPRTARKLNGVLQVRRNANTQSGDGTAPQGPPPSGEEDPHPCLPE